MSPADQLSRAIDAFKQWFATRKNSTRKTPEVLQQQPVELLAHYSRSRVSSELGLSGTQVKRWQGSDGDMLALVELPVLDEIPSVLRLPRASNTPQKYAYFCQKTNGLQNIATTLSLRLSSS